MNEKNNGVPNSTGKVYGIDLGTTFSVIAYLNASGEAVTIRNAKTRDVATTPSVVYIPKDPNASPIVGEVAEHHEEYEPDRVFRLFKRRFGEPNPDVEVNGKNLSPTDLSAILLKGMVEDAKIAGFDVHDVVITHPAYFTPDDIAATKKAGTDAGLNVIQMFPEPVAAALHYHMRQPNETKTIVVYDLGGGTFDATLVRISENTFEILGMKGKKDLGGDDWDKKIFDYSVEQAVSQTGCSRESIADNPETKAAFLKASTTAKIRLTSDPNVRFRLYVAGQKVDVELSREQFEEMSAPLLDDTRNLMKELMDEAKNGTLPALKRNGERIEKVDDFLLVGGSTMMPQVRRMVVDQFSSWCDSEPLFVEVNEAVAKGAALKAQAIQFQEAIKKEEEKLINNGMNKDEAHEQATRETLSNSSFNETTKEVLSGIKTVSVASRSYGVEVTLVIKDESGNESERNVISNILVMQTPLPCFGEKQYGLRTASGPTGSKLDLRVYSSETSEERIELDFEPKTLRKNTEVDVGPNLPKDSPIRVRFELNEEGLLSIRAVDETGKETTDSVKVDEGVANS